jgi:uncharacterized protein (DUF983 family)
VTVAPVILVRIEHSTVNVNVSQTILVMIARPTEDFVTPSVWIVLILTIVSTIICTLTVVSNVKIIGLDLAASYLEELVPVLNV